MARRSAADAALTRRAVLDAARRLFAERGYAAVAVPEIAAAAGVTHGAIYHHFGNKEALFREVFVEVEHELDDRVVAAALTGGDAWGAFVAGTRTVLEAMADPGYLQIALTDAPAVFGWHEWRRVDSSIGMRTLRTGLGLLRDEGYLAGADLDALAVLLFGGLTDAGITLADDEPALDVDRVVAATAAIVLALSPGADPPVDGAG